MRKQDEESVFCCICCIQCKHINQTITCNFYATEPIQSVGNNSKLSPTATCWAVGGGCYDWIIAARGKTIWKLLLFFVPKSIEYPLHACTARCKLANRRVYRADVVVFNEYTAQGACTNLIKQWERLRLCQHFISPSDWFDALFQYPAMLSGTGAHTLKFNEGKWPAWDDCCSHELTHHGLNAHLINKSIKGKIATA